MAKNTNPVLDLFKSEEFASYDPWGSTVMAHFAIADCLYRHGADIPDNWEYRPSIALHAGDELPDDASWFEMELDLLMRQGHYSNLVHAGNVLNRYAMQLTLAGKDY